MTKPDLEQVLQQLDQPEPSAALDGRILHGVKQMLALENYQKAEALLGTEGARLDPEMQKRVASGMAGIREQFGPGFEVAYQQHLQAQASKVSPDVHQDGPEL